MSAAPCLTIDVEDFYEGMATLGHVLDPPARPEPGLAALATVLADQPGRITTFVVGRHAEAAAPHLRALVAAGHEIASHGPDPIAGPSVLAGGSYQRLVPTPVVTGLVRRTTEPCVLYYHSIDFGHELPALASAGSPAPACTPMRTV